MPSIAQRKFLASYFPEIFHGENAYLAEACEEDFVVAVSGMGFDDAEPANPAQQRVAINLQAADILSSLDIHKNGLGDSFIYAEFSQKGAKALFDLHQEQREKHNKAKEQ